MGGSFSSTSFLEMALKRQVLSLNQTYMGCTLKAHYSERCADKNKAHDIMVARQIRGE
jgi:hypothetical protein